MSFNTVTLQQIKTENRGTSIQHENGVPVFTLVRQRGGFCCSSTVDIFRGSPSGAIGEGPIASFKGTKVTLPDEGNLSVRKLMHQTKWYKEKNRFYFNSNEYKFSSPKWYSNVLELHAIGNDRPLARFDPKCVTRKGSRGTIQIFPDALSDEKEALLFPDGSATPLLGRAIVCEKALRIIRDEQTAASAASNSAAASSAAAAAAS